MSKDNNDDMIANIEKEIIKTYGEASLIRGADVKDGDIIKTGSLGLDSILNGGIRSGWAVLLYGDYASGKSTAALHMAAEAQKLNRIVYYFDLENALNKSLLNTIQGLDVKKLTVLRPVGAEKTFDIIEKLLREINSPLFIILDSVAALVPLKELENAMEDQEMGTKAKLISKAMRKLIPYLAKQQSSLILINQVREKMNAYGDPEIAPGGRSIDFSIGAKLKCKVKGKVDHILDQEGNRMGHYTTITVEKCKWAVPFRYVKIPIVYGKGYDKFEEFIQFTLDTGIIEQKGPYYIFGENKFQGKEKLRQGLVENKELYKNILKKVEELTSVQET